MNAPNGIDRRSGGGDRRAGRPLTSRGRVIVGLEILCVFTALVAITGVVLALIEFGQIQNARERSAFDTCRILGALIIRSGQLTHHGAQAHRFLSAVGLSDCGHYALAVRHGTI